MKIMMYSTSSNNTEPFISSLKFLLDPTKNPFENFPDLEVFRYDSRYLAEAARTIAGNPELQAKMQAGQLKLPAERVRMDSEMIAAARDLSPDIILYVSAWAGDFVPTDETLAELNTIAPMVHLLCDSADPPWTIAPAPFGNIVRYHKKNCFSLTVCMDGADHWPGHASWGDPETKIGPAVTALTPLDPRYFTAPPAHMAYRERPYGVSWAANAGGWVRGVALQRLQSRFGKEGLLGVRLRDDSQNSYKAYLDFLRMSRVVINVPFTGSGAAKHVKGRVVEAGYAGCALLEWENSATRQFLTPRYEFLEYSGIDEMLDMAEWMVGHPKFCAEMAGALKWKMVTEHSPLAFWDKVFSGVGLSIGSATVSPQKPEEITMPLPVAVAPAVVDLPPANEPEPPAASNGVEAA